MKDVFLFSWNSRSLGAKELAKQLNVRRVKHNNSRYRQRPEHIIVNWGGKPDQVPGQKIVAEWINSPNTLLDTSNKLSFFQKMIPVEGPRCVPWTTDIQQAEVWNEKFPVVCISRLTGNSGHGTIVVDKSGQIPDCPLYTKYIFKDSEFRVHVVDGEIIDIQRKIKDPKIDRPKTWKIRSHDNGFIFVREGIKVPEDVYDQSKRAFYTSGLDFGAFDVIVKGETAYILEVNSAPGLEGSTIKKYSEALTKLIKKRRGEMSA